MIHRQKKISFVLIVLIVVTRCLAPDDSNKTDETSCLLTDGNRSAIRIWLENTIKFFTNTTNNYDSTCILINNYKLFIQIHRMLHEACVIIGKLKIAYESIDYTSRSNLIKLTLLTNQAKKIYIKLSLEMNCLTCDSEYLKQCPCDIALMESMELCCKKLHTLIRLFITYTQIK